MSTSLMVFGAVGWVLLILYWNYLGGKERAAKSKVEAQWHEAYAMAVSIGFVGTYEQWYRSLQERRPRIKKGQNVDWQLVYNDYFDHYCENRVRYTDPFGCSYVLRIPLNNPYHPYSAEAGEHDFPSQPFQTFEQWVEFYQNEYVQSLLHYERSALRKEIRRQVDKRIRLQHRHPARQHVAKV